MESRRASKSEAHGERMVAIAAASFVGTLAAILLLGWVVVRLIHDGADIWFGWTVSGQYESTRRVRVVAAPARQSRDTGGDFDGDGVEDELEVVWLTRDFLFSEETRGTLYVRSGASGAVLLAHPVPNPLCAAHWCGDLNRDGRDDVYVDDPSPTVFSFAR